MTEETTCNSVKEFMQIEQYPAFVDYTFWELLKKRKILINEEINGDIVEKVIIQIFKWNEEDEHVPIDKRKPITIYLNTLGGEVDIGLVLCNVIEQSKTPIHIIALAYACSMGSLILMAGHKRFAYPFSNVLIHAGSMLIGGTTTQVKDHMKFHDEKESFIKSYILDKTNITEERYNQMYRNEWWITSPDALKLGVIDEIIGDCLLK